MKKGHLLWIPRILNLVIALFLAIFALDVFDSKISFFKIVLGLFIHLIPSFLLLAAFLISYKSKKLAGFWMIGLGILITIYFSTYRSVANFAIISMPIFLVGVLYLLLKEK